MRRNLQLLASSPATCDCCRARSPLIVLQANCRQNRNVAGEGGYELCDFACVATCVATRNLRSVATCNAATGGATSVCNKPLTISSFLNLCDTSVILLIKFKSSQFSKSIIFVQMTPVYCALKYSRCLLSNRWHCNSKKCTFLALIFGSGCLYLVCCMNPDKCTIWFNAYFGWLPRVCNYPGFTTVETG